jgi:hypothetical protein
MMINDDNDDDNDAPARKLSAAATPHLVDSNHLGVCKSLHHKWVEIASGRPQVRAKHQRPWQRGPHRKHRACLYVCHAVAWLGHLAQKQANKKSERNPIFVCEKNEQTTGRSCPAR